MERILVPVDGSEGARNAAAFAARLARAVGAEITLVYVYEAPSAAAQSFAATAPGLADQTEARIAQASFEEAKQAMQGFEVRDHLVEIGEPVDTIVALAKSLNVQQIVMGSRGLSRMKELLLGSVSDGVVRKAHCPVTIVR